MDRIWERRRELHRISKYKDDEIYNYILLLLIYPTLIYLPTLTIVDLLLKYREPSFFFFFFYQHCVTT